jgi:hypothetical protein
MSISHLHFLTLLDAPPRGSQPLLQFDNGIKMDRRKAAGRLSAMLVDVKSISGIAQQSGHGPEHSAGKIWVGQDRQDNQDTSPRTILAVLNADNVPARYPHSQLLL